MATPDPAPDRGSALGSSVEKLANSVKCHVLELVFIDANLSNYALLEAGVRPGVEVVRLEAERDGVEQITQALAKRRGITSLHLVSHGCAGNVQLGNTWLCVEMLPVFATELQGWAEAFAPKAELLIYGCEVAKDSRGQALVACLSELTGARVAASATKTGYAALGGDWNLEVTTGEVAALSVFRPETMAAYPDVLVIW
jgi:hypothetical protein